MWIPSNSVYKQERDDRMNNSNLPGSGTAAGVPSQTPVNIYIDNHDSTCQCGHQSAYPPGEEYRPHDHSCCHCTRTPNRSPQDSNSRCCWCERQTTKRSNRSQSHDQERGRRSSEYCLRHDFLHSEHEHYYTLSASRQPGYRSPSRGRRRAASVAPSDQTRYGYRSRRIETPRVPVSSGALVYDSDSSDRPIEFSPERTYGPAVAGALRLTGHRSDSRSSGPISFSPPRGQSPDRRWDERYVLSRYPGEAGNGHVRWLSLAGDPVEASRRHSPKRNHHHRHHSHDHHRGRHMSSAPVLEQRARSLERELRRGGGMGLPIRARSHSPRFVVIR